MSHIVVIEDQPEIREGLALLLREKGYHVSTAGDGKAGIEIFKGETVDLVITDLVMPEQEGVETIRILRRDFPRTKIIAMSGGGAAASGEEYLELAKKLGAARIFQKPLDIEGLFEAVNELLVAESN